MATTHTAPRSPICDDHARPGDEHRPTFGASRTWSRVLLGVLWTFAAIAMPDGERRWSVGRYMRDAGDRTKFGCDFRAAAFLVWCTDHADAEVTAPAIRHGLLTVWQHDRVEMPADEVLDLIVAEIVEVTALPDPVRLTPAARNRDAELVAEIDRLRARHAQLRGLRSQVYTWAAAIDDEPDLLDAIAARLTAVTEQIEALDEQRRQLAAPPVDEAYAELAALDAGLARVDEQIGKLGAVRA